jgi:hypothetical protein
LILEKRKIQRKINPKNKTGESGKTKKEADDFVDKIQKESSNHDEYTTFWVEEVNG